MRYRVSVLFPIFNDGEVALKNLHVIYMLCKKTYRDFEIVLIDDASDPSYSQRVKAYVLPLKEVRLVLHSKNVGIASTCRELYDTARGDRMVISSLDGGWNMHDVIKLVHGLDEYDIVVGTRVDKLSYTHFRRCISYIYTMTIRIFFGLPAYDAGSAKAFRRKIYLSIPVVSQSVYSEAERLIRARLLGYSIGIIPVSHYPKPSRQPVTKMIIHILDSVWDMVRLWLSLRVSNR